MTPVRMSKVESSERNALAYKEAFNKQDIDGILALLSDDCLFEPINDGVIFRGKNEISMALAEAFTSAPKLEIEEIFGVGLHVILRWRMNDQRGVDIFKFRGDLICEKLSYIKT